MNNYQIITCKKQRSFSGGTWASFDLLHGIELWVYITFKGSVKKMIIHQLIFPQQLFIDK